MAQSIAKIYLGFVYQPEDSEDIHLYLLKSVYHEDNFEEYDQATLKKWQNRNQNYKKDSKTY